jgi:[acyl-carrier-protein] S-malonyltransferase
MRHLPAFLFPAQGCETVGMGAALLRADRRRFNFWVERAEAASGLAIRRAVTDGPASALAATEVAQPALLAISLAVADAAEAIGLRPGVLAGHGVGEYAAAVVAGALDADDALLLVAERGRRMAAAEREQSGTMAFVVGLPLAEVEHICAVVRQRHGYVTVAHANSPRHSVISGNASSVDAALERVRRRGANAGLLPARGAYNSLLMAKVQAGVARLATTMRWRDASTPVIDAADGRALTSGAAIRSAVIRRETLAVHWTTTMDALIDLGHRAFLELGPGRTLTTFAHQCAPKAMVMAADGPAALAIFRDRLAATGATRWTEVYEERLAG